MHRAGLLALGVVLLLAADRTSGSPPGDDAAAIAAASRAFSLAFVEGDTATVRELYTETCVLLPPGQTLRGRDAVVRWFAPREGRENLAHAMNSDDLRVDGKWRIDYDMWHRPDD